MEYKKENYNLKVENENILTNPKQPKQKQQSNL